MATATSLAPHPERIRSMIVPREHGAWGLLLLPMLTGASLALAAGGRVTPLLLFAVAALALFWLRTPVESLLGAAPLRPQSAAERNPVLFTAVAVATIAVLALAALFADVSNWDLALLGAASAAAFALQALLKKLGRSTRMAAQVVGVAGLTVTAPASYCAATGRLDRTALALWLANWIFAAGQVHFVQLRIHAARVSGWRAKLRRGRSFLLGQTAVLAAVLVAAHYALFSWLVPLAFVPALARSARWFFRGPQPLAVRSLGWWEVALSVTFSALLVLAFLL